MIIHARQAMMLRCSAALLLPHDHPTHIRSYFQGLEETWRGFNAIRYQIDTARKTASTHTTAAYLFLTSSVFGSVQLRILPIETDSDEGRKYKCMTGPIF